MLVRFFRFGRALIVGSGATLTDFSIFTTCVRGFGVTPTIARIPALLAGACFQFFGNRSYTFRATAGKLSRQASLFVVAETITLVLNYSLFHYLAGRLSQVPPELVSFLGTFLVFVGFAYPVRKLIVFRMPAP